ncbi:MAG: response regulator transcription factor [Proteobacteria bacterium]|nr:response regulator transcription factor [Pseudomonadota bacterium]
MEYDKKLNILIIDDHPLFRKGMISILENSGIAEKILEAGNLKTACELIDTANIDLVTLDLNLPEEDGIKLLNRYVERHFKIIVVTTYNSSFLLQELLRRGADGYIKKENLYENLIEAINCVLNGHVYVNDDNSVKKDALSLEDKASRYYCLTNAEKEVFKLLAQGKNAKEIALVLGKSYKTVENQKNAIISKMQIKSDLELFKIAIRLNLTNL